MRIIKFRAWHKTEKWIKTVSFWDFPMESLIFTDEDKEELDGQDTPALRADIGDCELMQFTGLYDKNGKEIYEGDIVQVTERLSVVFEWLPGHAAFVTRRLNTKHVYIDEAIAHWPHYEILGNIYENPELLKP